MRERVECGPPFGEVELPLIDAVASPSRAGLVARRRGKGDRRLEGPGARLEHRPRFDAKNAADLPGVCVDADKLAWAAATLVGGALRYLGDAANPTIHVTVDHDPTAAEATITVRDHGPGIPHAQLRSLLRREREGHAGLALVLLHDVLVADGGQVVIESSTDAGNHGTTVRMFLPTGAARAKARDEVVDPE